MKIAVVTGATGYVGKAVAKQLAADFEVVRLSRGGEDGSLALDLTDETAVAMFLDALQKECGPISVLVHAAGIAPERGALIDASASSARTQMEGNFLTGFTIITACARRMKERGEGIIIGVTTSAATEPAAGKGLGAYVAAKCALQGMLMQLRAELSSSGVRVHAIAPGLMEGGMNADLPKAFFEIAKAKSGALTSADDVAIAISTLVREGGDATVLLAPEMRG